VRVPTEKEGRRLQALVGDALAGPVDPRKNAAPRPHVMAAYRASHATLGPLYKKLAE
jgi:hypothetical protein